MQPSANPSSQLDRFLTEIVFSETKSASTDCACANPEWLINSHDRNEVHRREQNEACASSSMDEQQQSRLFAELELRDVEETGRELGSGAYGVVTEVYVKGLK